MAVNKVVYLLITFFLGFCGIQKFYAKKTLQGGLCLIFFWTGIPEIIAIIDFIIALFKKSDANGNIIV